MKHLLFEIEVMENLTHRNSWFSIRSSYSSNPNSTLEKPIIRYLKETTARISSKLRKLVRLFGVRNNALVFFPV